VLGSINKELLKAGGGDATGYNIKSVNKQVPKMKKLVQRTADGSGDQSMMYVRPDPSPPKLTIPPAFSSSIIMTASNPVKRSDSCTVLLGCNATGSSFCVLVNNRWWHTKGVRRLA
jgi:hypothetical protein